LTTAGKLKQLFFLSEVGLPVIPLEAKHLQLHA